MTHSKHTTAKDRHYLLLSEILSSLASVVDLIHQGLRMMLEVFDYLELF